MVIGNLGPKTEKGLSLAVHLALKPSYELAFHPLPELELHAPVVERLDPNFKRHVIRLQWRFKDLV